MKLAVFENSADEKEIKKIIGFVGMIGDKDNHSEEKQKKLIEKMEKLKQLSKEKFAEKQKQRETLKKTDDLSGKLLSAKKLVIDAFKMYSNKPGWDEAPDAANVLVYSPSHGWLFGTFEDAIVNSLKNGWLGNGKGIWLPFKYHRIDDSVEDWTKTLEFRPKAITVGQAIEKNKKTIDSSTVYMLTKDESMFFEKIKASLSKRNNMIITPKIIKDKASRVRFGNMNEKYKIIANIEKAGLIKKTDKGWELV